MIYLYTSLFICLFVCLCNLGNCAVDYAYAGPWWYEYRCWGVYATARYGGPSDRYHPYMYWVDAYGPDQYQALKSLTLKIKPIS